MIGLCKSRNEARRDKLKILTRHLDEEIEANCLRTAAEQVAIEREVRDAANAFRDMTATDLSHLGDDTPKPSADPDGAETVIECISSKHMDEVGELEPNLPALQTHAAQLAALETADGTSAGSAE
eukprot:264595-Amphidinium_carterae.3